MGKWKDEKFNLGGYKSGHHKFYRDWPAKFAWDLYHVFANEKISTDLRQFTFEIQRVYLLTNVNRMATRQKIPAQTKDSADGSSVRVENTWRDFAFDNFYPGLI